MTRFCDLEIVGNRCYYRLNSCSEEEFNDIINFKSWVYRSWKYGKERKYFSFVYVNRGAEKIIWSNVGFAPILIRHLRSMGFMINGIELFRARPIQIGNMLYKLYDFQSQAIDEWIKEDCCGVIKMPTGSGKTISSCEIIRRMGVRTLIIVHISDILVNAWFNTLVEQFGDEVKSHIGIIGGGLKKGDRKSMRIDANTSFEANVSKDIVITTAQSLLNVKKLQKISNERFGLLIWDEVHHVSAEQFSKIASSIRAPYRLGLSATLMRGDGTGPLIYGLMGDLVYKITIKELISKGVLVEPVFNTMIINDAQIQNDVATCGLVKLELSRYTKQMSASSTIKMNYVMRLAKSLRMNGKKFIMYTDFVESKTNRIFTRDFYVMHLNNNGVKVIGVSSDMSGKEREKVFTMLEHGRLDGLIFGKLGAEGVNIPKVDSVIMVNATKSTILFPQRVGRSMRTVKSDSSKKNAFIYEILLNIPMELKWSGHNFYEYEVEGYIKEKINIGQ